MDQTSGCVEPIQAHLAANASADVGDTILKDAKIEPSTEPISEPLISTPQASTPTLASGRAQRVRKLPKRWEDANIETGFFTRKSAKNNNNSNYNCNSPNGTTTNRKNNKVDKEKNKDNDTHLVASTTESNTENTVTPANIDKVDSPAQSGTKPLTKLVTTITKENILKVVKGNIDNLNNNLKLIKVKIVKKKEQDIKDAPIKSEIKTEEPAKEAETKKAETKEAETKEAEVKEQRTEFQNDESKDCIKDVKNEIVLAKSEKTAENVKTNDEIMTESKTGPQSDAEGDAPIEEENDDPEFDPEEESEKLWCICRQPYDDRFMICCDCCEEWYHGKCVGVTKLQGRKIEKLKQEWFCSPCDDGIQIGTERSILKLQALDKREQIEASEKAVARAAKLAKLKEVKSKTVKSEEVKKPRKSIDNEESTKSPVKEVSVRKKKIPKIDTEKAMQKELKKSAIAAKAALKERMLKMQVSVSGSETEKQNTEVESVKSQSTKQSLIPQPISSPTKKKHYKEFQDTSLNELFKVDPVLNRSLSTSAVSEVHSVVLERRNSSSSGAKTERRKSVGTTAGSKRERTESLSRHSEKTEAKSSLEVKSSGQRNSVSSTVPPASTSNKIEGKKDERREFFRSRILEIFISRYMKRTNKELSPVQEHSLKAKTKEIEVEFYRLYRSDAKKYCIKLRSLLSNLKDTKNELYRKVILDKISVERLAAMSVEELAGSELAKWREQEKKKDIEMIKRDQEEQASLVSSMTKKTHKGDVMVNAEEETVLDTGKGNEPIDSVAAFLDDDIPISGQSSLLQSSSHFETPGDGSSHNNIASFETVSAALSPQDVLTEETKKELEKEACNEVVYNVEEMLGISRRIRTTSVSSSVSGSISENVSMEDASISSTTSNNGNSSAQLESKKLAPVREVSTSKLDQEIEKLLNSHQQHHNQISTGLPDEEHSSSQLSIYKGEVHMPDVGTFHVKAVNIGGKIGGAFQSSVSGSMNIHGRADPTEIWDYVQKLMLGRKTEFGLIRLLPDNGQKVTYDEVFEYLHQKSRYGVIKNHAKFYRDLYLIPLSESEDVPEPLTSIPGFRIEPKNHRPNMLLVLLIKIKGSGSIDHHLSAQLNEHHYGLQHEQHSAHRANEEISSEEKRKKDSIDDEPYIPEPVSTKRLKMSDMDDLLEPMDTTNNNVIGRKDQIYEPEVSDPRIKSSVSMSFMKQDTIIMTAITQTSANSGLNNDQTLPTNDSKHKDIHFDLEKLKKIQIPENLKDLLRIVKNNGSSITNNSANSVAQTVDGTNFQSPPTITHNDGSPMSNFNNDHNYQPHPHPSYGPQAAHHEMHASYNDRDPSHGHAPHPPPAGNYPPPPPPPSHHYSRDPQPHEMSHLGHPSYPPQQQPPQHHHPHQPHGFDGRQAHSHHRPPTPPPPPLHHGHGPYGELDEHSMHSQQQYPPHPPGNHHHHSESRDHYYDNYPPRGRGRGGRGGRFGRNHGGGRFIKRGGSKWDNSRY